MIGVALIDGIDEAGYLIEKIEEIAARLGTPAERVESVLAIIHTFEPTGVGARDLAECLSIQLIERDRFDPAMQLLVANLPLLAKRDFAALRRICGVDDEDLADMVAEIRRLDPKPGRAFVGGAIQPVVPDVTVRPAADGSWHVELNAEGLPRVLVNQTYAARVSRMNGSAADKSFVTNCLQTANWLTKSLEQRARTILKVASEIVRHQDAFFAHGVEHLRPLNLKTIADAIGMHKSTVSRVTSNKYMACPRGLFELKYFFTASIPAAFGRRIPFGRGGPLPHQAIDRAGTRRRGTVRRRDRRAPQGSQCRHRAADGRQISREPAHSLLGRTPPRKAGAAVAFVLRLGVRIEPDADIYGNSQIAENSGLPGRLSVDLCGLPS